MEKPFNPSFDSHFFPVVHHVLRTFFKDYNAEKSEKIVGVKGFRDQFKFVVEWQDKNQSSFNIFRIIKDIEEKDVANVVQ